MARRDFPEAARGTRHTRSNIRERVERAIVPTGPQQQRRNIETLSDDGRAIRVRARDEGN